MPAAQGGLAQMLAQQGGSKELVETARSVESVPGGPELLYTVAAEEIMKAQGIPKKDAKKIRLYEIGGYVEKQRGGSVHKAAERTRRAGRGDDSIMLHMSPEEAEVISAMWGEPEVNPKTGLGEYGFLSKVWKKIKKGVKKVVKSKAFRIIAPLALSIFMPGIGTAIGMKLGMTGAMASVAGNAIVQGGLGAVTGGKEGAIKGALTGGLGAAAGAYGSTIGKAVGLSGKTADVVGSALISGAGSSLTGGEFMEGAIAGGLGSATRGTMDRFGADARSALGMKPASETAIGQYIAGQEGLTAAPDPGIDAGGDEYTPTLDRPVTTQEVLEQGATPGSRVPRTASPAPTTDPLAVPGAPAPTMTQNLMGLASKYAVPAMAGLTTLGAADYSQNYEDEGPPQLPQSFNESLPVFQMDRRFQGLQNEQDYYTYGQAGSPQSGQHLFITPSDPFPGDTSAIAAPQPAGGLESATAPQPVRVPPGREGMIQRQGLAQQGWRYDAASQMMYPPQGAGQARGGYQRGGEFDHWAQNEDVHNAIPTVSREGGHHVQGPGSGRSDDIPAYLSDGEYVIDAESVSLLGDGSGSEGARRLDEMRKQLRKHKAGKMKSGEFTHKAKKPAAYMNKVKKLRRTVKYEHGGLHNAGGTTPVQPNRPAIGGNA